MKNKIIAGQSVAKARAISSSLRFVARAILLLAFAFIVPSAARAQVMLQAPNIYNGDPNMVPLGVATGDFNGNGFLDFVVAEHSLNPVVSDQLAFYTANSDGSFTETSIVPVKGTIAGQLYATNHIIGVGSFNGPGEPLGVAVALTTSTLCGSGGPGVFMLYGQAGGSTISLCVPTTAAPTSIAVADFNNDGFDDWAISNSSGAAAGTISVYLNIANPAAGESGFYFYANYSATGLNFSGTLYGTIVAGNLGPQESGPSIALLASTGPFSQFVDVFENFEVTSRGVTTLTFSIPASAVSTNNTLSDIAIGNVNGSGTAAVIGIGTGTLSYIPVTDISNGQARPLLGALTRLPTGAAGYALAVGTFDENIYSDIAFLSLNHNFGVSLDPSFTDSPLITPFGAAGQNIATGLSTALNKWIVVDAGIYQQENSLSFAEVPEARSIAVYLVDPTTGFPAEPSIYSPSTTSEGILPAFAVGDFNGDGLPDVAVLGLDQSSFGATVALFLNISKPTGLPLFQAQPVFDLGAGANISTFGINAFSMVAGSFRAFIPDIALLNPDGVTLLENQGVNSQGQVTFAVDPNCQGVQTSPLTNCYLGGDPNFPGLAFTETIRPPMIAADVTGKGYADVIIAIPENCNVSAGKPRSAIYLLVSNGDGTFQTPVYVPSPVANPVGLAFGKLMGTAFNDLVVVNGGEQCSTAAFPTNPGAALLPNNADGSGTFGSPLALFLTTATSPFPFVSSVAVADMNRDGTPDVVISANDGIHVLLNSKSNPGAFTDQGAVPLYSATDNIVNASLIDIADIDQDGLQDVVAVVGGNIYVFRGDGVGGIGSPVQGFSSGPNSYQLKAIDVNGDGSPDVLVSNTSGFSPVLNAMAAPTGSPLAQFNNISLNFGGIAAGLSETLQFDLVNSGAAPLLITNIAFANSTGNEFTYQVVSCTGASFGILPMSMPPGAACTFNVVFAPGTLGPVSAQMLFYDNAATSSAPTAPATTGTSPYVQTIQLTGAGIESQANTFISVTNSPSVVAVGTVVHYNVVLSNLGPDPATNVAFAHFLEPTVSIGTIPSNCAVVHAGLTTSLTCAVGTIAVGSSANFSFTIATTAQTTLSNPFTFTQDQSDANTESTTDDISVIAAFTITENIATTDTISALTPCAAAVSSGITATRGGFVYSPITRQYTQTITLTNNSAAAISGPLYLLIAGLSSNATLLNSSGKTACSTPAGVSYVTDSIASLASGGSASIVLKFNNSSTGAAITYTTAVEAGSGTP